MTPNVDVKGLGYFGESSINEKNVAMSATESVYGNPLALAHDPFVVDGLAEDSLQSMVAPFITSAREGVLYLGELIKKIWFTWKETASCSLIKMKFGTWRS